MFKTFTDLIFCVLLIFILLVTILAVSVRSQPSLIKDQSRKKTSKRESLSKKLRNKRRVINRQRRRLQSREEKLAKLRRRLREQRQTPKREHVFSYRIGRSTMTVKSVARSKKDVTLRLPGYGPVSWKKWIVIGSHFFGGQGVKIEYDVGPVRNVLRPLRKRLLDRVSRSKFKKIIQSEQRFGRHVDPYLKALTVNDFQRSLRGKEEFLRALVRWNGRRTRHLSGKRLDRYVKTSVSGVLNHNGNRNYFSNPGQLIYEKTSKRINTKPTRPWITIQPETRKIVFGPPEFRITMRPDRLGSMLRRFRRGSRLQIEYRPPADKTDLSSRAPPDWLIEQAFGSKRVHLLTERSGKSE